MQWRDRGEHYGWTSILAHWLSVVVVFALLFIGNSIGMMGGSMIRLHVALASTSWPFLVARVVWRWRSGHPTSRKPHHAAAFLSKLCHHLLLVAICLMLVSGPLMAGAEQIPVVLFGQRVLSPLPVPADWFELLHRVHVVGAEMLAYAILIHIGAVVKHMIWDRDGTFGRIMTPEPGRSVAEALREDDVVLPG